MGIAWSYRSSGVMRLPFRLRLPAYRLAAGSPEAPPVVVQPLANMPYAARVAAVTRKFRLFMVRSFLFIHCATA